VTPIASRAVLPASRERKGKALSVFAAGDPDRGFIVRKFYSTAIAQQPR
jgi:hypothetical protein